MTEDRVYNFSAGPSVLPEAVLQRARAEMMNARGSGMSVMEMSHRSAVFSEIFAETKEKLRCALHVPESHEILFLQGGATLQFAAIPMNLMEGGTADYAITGNFSSKAAKEAEKYGKVHIACDTSDTGHNRIPVQSELSLTPGAKYFYYCANNTVYGTEWPRGGAAGLRHVLRHPLPPGGRRAFRPSLCRGPEEHGPCGPHGRDRRPGSCRACASLYAPGHEL